MPPQFVFEMTDDDMDKLLEEMGKLQDAIDACDGWETDRLID